MIPPPPTPTLFPYTTLFRSVLERHPEVAAPLGVLGDERRADEDGSSHRHEAAATRPATTRGRSEEHTSELQSRGHLVCRLLLEKKKQWQDQDITQRNVGVRL